MNNQSRQYSTYAYINLLTKTLRTSELTAVSTKSFLLFVKQSFQDRMFLILEILQKWNKAVLYSALTCTLDYSEVPYSVTG